MDAFVAQHLRGVSRTYALLIPWLPPPLDGIVGTAYLLMRIVDTLEDAPGLTPAGRRAALRQLEGVLKGDQDAATCTLPVAGELEAERRLMRDAAEVLRRVASLPEPYRSAAQDCACLMSQGVRLLLDRSAERGRPYPAIVDLNELREYCFYVAGVVGEMLCTMMVAHLHLPALRRLRMLAMELGIGLQLVNILKDAGKDARQGRRYLPAAEDPAASEAAVYQIALTHARECLRRGIGYVLALPPAARELRTFCGLPIAWGGLTLARAEEDSSHAKITRQQLRSAMDTFARLAADDDALRAWLLSTCTPAKMPAAVTCAAEAVR